MSVNDITILAFTCLVALLVALLLQSEWLFMKLSTFRYIKFVPSRLKTLLITKQGVVEEIK